MSEKEEKTYVAAGKLFCFSEGEYSDYGYVGHFLALEPITDTTIQNCKDRCRARVMAGEGSSYGGKPDLEDEHDIERAMRDLFVPELTRMGMLMDIECVTIHLGSYGRLEI